MKIFVGAGEASGDRILASLLKGLRQHFPGMNVCGFGGSFSEAQGLKSIIPFDRLAVSGVGDVLRHGAFLAASYFRAKKSLRNFKPDLVLLVDYPGMNVGLARYAKQLGFQVHYVAPPQLWAYRNPESRLHRLRQSLRGVSLQVLFPFEAELYQPWAARIGQGHFHSVTLVMPSSGKNLLLCPSSRRDILRRNLSLWLNHLSEWKGDIDILTPEYLVEETKVVVAKQLTPRFDKLSDRRVVVLSEKEQAFSRAACAISFPGTMTLELFLHRIPTSVWAVLDPLTLWAGRRKLRNRFTALPNLLLDKKVFPEWVGTTRNFKHSPPIWNTASVPMELDIVTLRQKMGASNGVEAGVQACLELLL